MFKIQVYTYGKRKGYVILPKQYCWLNIKRHTLKKNVLRMYKFDTDSGKLRVNILNESE